MKKIQKMCFLALVGLMVGTSCEKTPATPNPQTNCIEGVVIGFDCPSYLFVSLPKGQLGSYFKNGNGEYTNAITISNIQIADKNVDLRKRGTSVFFTIDPNQDPSKCAEEAFCTLAEPQLAPKEIYCVKSISNKSCK